MLLSVLFLFAFWFYFFVITFITLCTLLDREICYVNTNVFIETDKICTHTSHTVHCRVRVYLLIFVLLCSLCCSFSTVLCCIVHSSLCRVSTLEVNVNYKNIMVQRHSHENHIMQIKCTFFFFIQRISNI